MSFLKLPMTKPGLVTLVKVVCSMSRFLVALRRELRGTIFRTKSSWNQNSADRGWSKF
ncbi:hypothetical protein [Leptospira borgpetersenii]|uniref:Uncharacterized protein n=1 Tax=Leptospira borgpetersenii serovar Hardjo-bovis str. Sponselee TaxID=1303729 RepID=M6C9Q1_LEPBO|nr:hypothetical protein [Leptospira borgpetersenii]EMJ82955.1 hypothetical protein LEP1GSC016_1563 [Leptospira borgpetersenii serovar Hardjo-bovis str. Sponselee]MBE8349966.1 hypothetical protein [Leptospira borgpetersenii serovar Hardjo-bovis]MBE8360254.1 hypothetical protein [Leptospira borgpetersenii serovar Hardjo-bovis]MBE8370026.1 hypothetical protein [Leptospira borgpetersenii serovar Hardjo-bovis]MBE8373066.1 hypothetical protein [Leptospira borgpetersenii serovar Hardjo-bovis]